MGASCVTYIRTDSMTIHYTYLQGLPGHPTLVCIHGLGQDRTVWRKMLSQVDPACGWLIYDLPGHGSHPNASDPLAVRACVRQLKDLLDYLHLEKVDLVGHRFGSYLAMQFARSYPAAVQSLTLIAFPFSIGNSDYARDIASNAQLLAVDRELYEKKLLIDGLHTLTLGNARTLLQALRYVNKHALTAPLLELIDRYNTPGEAIVQLLQSLQQPVLFLQGEYDPTFPATLAMLLSHYAPISQLMVIPDSSYFVPLERPYCVAKQINQFLSGNLFPTALTVRSETSAFLRTIMNKVSLPRAIRSRKLSLSLLQEKSAVYWNGLEIDGKWTQRCAREILLYLIMNDGAVKRDSLIDAFYPDADLEQARNQLRVQLSHLNQQFSTQSAPELKDVLLITRDSIGLNADARCDLADYLDAIDQLLWSAASLPERCELFLDFLADYQPHWFSGFRSAWGLDRAKNLRSKLAQLLASLLAAAKEAGDPELMRRLLAVAKKVEPYRGFAKEWARAAQSIEK